jgi:nitrilase
MDRAMRDALVSRDAGVAEVVDGTSRAASFFVDPTGEQIGDALQDEEGILYAEIDLNRCVEPKQFHDVVGYYNRFDVFELSINRTRQKPASFSDQREAGVERDSRSNGVEGVSDGTGSSTRVA